MKLYIFNRYYTLIFFLIAGLCAFAIARLFTKNRYENDTLSGNNAPTLSIRDDKPVGVRNANDESSLAGYNIRELSIEFQTNYATRGHSAQYLLPHIKKGMNTNNIITIFGEPAKKNENGREWRYSIFWGQFFVVYFDRDFLVERVLSGGVENVDGSVL